MDTLTTIASVPAVLALVNIAKSAGLSGRWAPLAAIIIAVTVNLAGHFLAGNEAYNATIQGIMLGLAAAGIYDVTGTETVGMPDTGETTLAN